MDVALVAKLRSGPLYRYRKEHGYTQKRAAEIAGVSGSLWNICECMRFKGISWENVARIAASIGMTAEEVCPAELRDWKGYGETVQYRQVEANRLLAGNQARRLMLPDPSEEQRDTDDEALREAMRKVLRTLTYREREIITLRYGLVDSHVHTLEEVGKRFDLSKERIRSIECGAIRMMHHPVRAAMLERFLESQSARENDGGE